MNFENQLLHWLEKSEYGVLPWAFMPDEVELEIQDQAGLTRLYDEKTDCYLESQTEYLFRVYDYHFPQEPLMDIIE
jgi:hypothetical protein